MISTDLNFVIQSWNRVAERTYGWLAHEVIGKGITDVIPPEFMQDTRELSVQTVFEKGIWEGEVTQPRKDGSIVNILSSVSV